MSPIRLITATHPACFGVACHQHQHCKRYAAVDNMPGHEQAIATCLDGEGARPLYLPQQQPQHAKVAA